MLPFKDKSFDAVVIDPPFQQGGKKGMYAEAFSVAGKTTNRLLVDYVIAIAEGLRVARIAMIAKTCDCVESGKFVPFTARLLGRVDRPIWDMIITVRNGSPTHPAWKSVQHFRHNYAYYLIWKL